MVENEKKDKNETEAELLGGAVAVAAEALPPAQPVLGKTDLLGLNKENLFPEENLQKYYDRGFSYGPNSMGNAESCGIREELNVVLGMFKNDSMELTKKRMEGLKKEIEELKRQKQEKAGKIEALKMTVEGKNADVTKVAEEKEELKKKENIKPLSWSVLLVMVMAIGLFLFVVVAYLFIGKATIVPLLGEMVGDPRAVDRLSWLFPFLVLGLGTMIHPALETALDVNKPKRDRWLGVLGLVLLFSFAFGLDAIMGIELSRKEHIKEFPPNMTDVVWRNMMAWKKIHFYIVLLCGFVSYLLWGFMVSYILSQPYFKKSEIGDLLAKKIDFVRTELVGMKTEISVFAADVGNFENEIEEKQKEMDAYGSGATYFDKIYFGWVVGNFMKGYATYITNYYAHERTDKTGDAKDAGSELNDKMKAAKSEREAWEEDVWPKLLNGKENR